MERMAFSIFGLGITWYGIILTTAMVVGITLSIRSGRKQGFIGDDFLDIGVISLPIAIIFARVYYVIFNLSHYETFYDMINIRQGGLAIHGGLFGGVLAGVIVAKFKEMNVIKSADVMAPFIALAQSIGRWGNFVNQEAHGGPTNLPWAITVDGVKVHPTFLYESIWTFLIFIFLSYKTKNKDYDGQITAYYMILYSIGRFGIEALRTDSLMLGSLRVAQVISILLIISGFVLMLIFKDRGVGQPYKNMSKGKSEYSFAQALRKEKNKGKK